MAQPNKHPKAMSSRLATMKFMQRAAASPNSSPSAPLEPPSKRQRMSNGSRVSSQASTPRDDAQETEEVHAADERKRTDALEREAANRGETKWYLSVQKPEKAALEPPLRILSAAYSALDAPSTAKERLSDQEGEEGVRPTVAGRRSFGKFNRIVEKQQNPDRSSESASEGSEDDDDEGDESDDPTGAKALIAQSRKEAGDKARVERKAKKQADQAEALRLADERRKKQVKLNGLSSISANSGGHSPSTNITCHQCGQKGHIQRNCPQQQERSRKR